VKKKETRRLLEKEVFLTFLVKRLHRRHGRTALGLKGKYRQSFSDWGGGGGGVSFSSFLFHCRKKGNDLSLGKNKNGEKGMLRWILRRG